MTHEVRSDEGLSSSLVGKRITSVNWALAGPNGGAAILVIEMEDGTALWVDHQGDDMSSLSPSLRCPYPPGTTITTVRA